MLSACLYLYADKFTAYVQNVRLPNACMHQNVSCVQALCIRRTRSLCIRRTLWRHVTIGTPMVIFFAVWLSFDCFWRIVHCTNRQKHSKLLVYQSSQVYQDCTNSVRTVYQSSKTVDSQNSKNDPWCTNRYRTTKTVPTVYKSSKTVKRQSKEQKWGVKVKGELNSTLKNIWLTMKIYV